MGRIGLRNAQPIWYALYNTTTESYDSVGEGYDTSTQVSTYPTYSNPVKVYGNVSPARGSAMTQQFGVDTPFDKVIVLSDRNTPIDEYAVLWVDREPELDANGALKVDANGEIVTPWDYIVRKVGRGFNGFGSAVIAVSKVTVS